MKLISASTLGAVGLALAATAVAGEATIYSERGFQGRALTLTGSDPNIGNNGFGDVGSIRVHSGRWEFCARPGFAGRCESLGPGSYYSLSEDWRHPVLSVRDTTEPLDVRAYDPAPRAADLYPRASIELYPRRGFRGPAMVLDRNVRWLERRGVDEREVSSVIVNEGVWQLCTEPGFRGTCGTFEPGHYARIGPRLNNQVSSLRRVG